MKKITLLTVFVFSVVAFANAQIALGVKGGLNFANADVDNLNSDSKTGYHFGAFLEIGAGGIAIQPEILYSFKGTDDIDLSYLEVPILLKKNFAKVLNIHLGPQFGFLTNAETDNEDLNLALAISNSDSDLAESMKSTEVSAVVGAGVNLPMGLTGGVRYVFGLNDVWDNDLVDTEVKNKMVQVYVGFKFAGN